MSATFKTICRTTNVRYTTRDAGMGAGIMLAGTLVLVVIGTMLKQSGYGAAGDAVLMNGFMFALVLSMPFWLLKGQPWRAQVVLIGGILLVLTAIAYVAYLW
jgi:hypothetical protein